MFHRIFRWKFQSNWNSTALYASKMNHSKRYVVTKASGALLEEPHQEPLGIIRIFAAVIPGLLIGATISKNIANFLEENDLFVPADDDDDDD